MAKEARDAVVSVRISEEDQSRLRRLAAERGTSVSELVRSVVVREVSEPPVIPRASGVTSGTATPRGTTTATSPSTGLDRGFTWEVPDAGPGPTITLRS